MALRPAACDGRGVQLNLVGGVVLQSALTDLEAAQLSALLTHEMAHVRRHDYLVNLLQCVVEVFLFFHPAVWWISRQVREERACCCDDVVVEQSPANRHSTTTIKSFKCAI